MLGPFVTERWPHPRIQRPSGTFSFSVDLPTYRSSALGKAGVYRCTRAQMAQLLSPVRYPDDQRCDLRLAGRKESCALRCQ